MGTPLTGTSVSSSYQSILKIGDNSPISTTIKQLSDGAGHDINIWLGENYTEFRQFLNISPVSASGSSNLTFRSYSATTPGTIIGSLSVTPIVGANTKMYVTAEVDGIQIESASAVPVIQNGEMTQKIAVVGAGLQIITNTAIPTPTSSDRGLIRFDTATSKFKGWTGSTWVDFH